MPRAPRIHVPGGIYHTILRGNHRNAIFRTEADRDEFELILAKALERFQAHILAYCWMTNHIHAIVQVADRPLGNLVQLLASRYARRHQQRVPTTGHLFERRYRARLIADTSYLMQAVRYIHRNPVEAGMVRDPLEYPWSSHRCYVGAPSPEWLFMDTALKCFGTPARKAVAAYLKFVGASDSECAVSAWVDNRRDKTADGSGKPRSKPTRIKPAPESDSKPASASASGSELESLLIKIADQHGVSVADVRSPKRYRFLSAPRATFAHAALSSGLATLSEVASFLGRAPSSVSGLMQRRHASLDSSSQ